MKCKVQKPFPYAHDGIRNATLAEGDEVEIRDGLVEGLVASGCLADPRAEAGKAKPAPKAKPGAAAAPAAETEPEGEADAKNAEGEAAAGGDAAAAGEQKPADA